MRMPSWGDGYAVTDFETAGLLHCCPETDQGCAGRRSGGATAALLMGRPALTAGTSRVPSRTGAARSDKLRKAGERGVPIVEDVAYSRRRDAQMRWWRHTG
jgi:hypothetical protein